MANQILDEYNNSLIDMIEKSESGLNVNDLRSFLESYKTAHIREDEPFIRQHYQNCLTRCEQEVFDPTSLREPFKRTLTSRFVGLFPPTNGFDQSGRYISRRMLPGLFLALEKMVGSNVLQKDHLFCKDLIETMKNSEEGFYWEDLYTHPDAQAAVDDLLISLLPHFSNPMKRITWMLAIINNDLAPAEQYEFEGPANKDWFLDDRGAILLLRSLYAHPKHLLSNKDSAKELAHKHGAETTRQLLALITTLDKAEV